MRNRGLELSLNTVNVTGKDVTWSTTFNISFLQNRVLALGAAGDDIFPGPNFLNDTNVLRGGQPVGSLFGLVREGTWSTAEADQALKYNRLPGDLKFKDQNGDGQINDKDRVILGKTIPTGFDTLRYRAVDLTLDLQFTYGNDVMNLTHHSALDRTGQANSYSRAYTEAWTPENQNTSIAQVRPSYVRYDSRIDSYKVEDGSFIRGRNVVLGYTFPAPVLEAIKLTRLRLYVSAQNFFVLTKYKGYDPEVTTYGNPFAQGIQFFDYPKARTLTAGLNVGQAYFMRAFLYYHLVRLYGDVPLLTEPVDGASPNLYPARAPQADVYALIIADLQAAEQAGLPAVDRNGRISTGAVKSLLASVYLTSAGYPLQVKANYQKAADKAAEVIDAGNYPLFTDYAFLHDNAHKNQGELILQAQYAFGISTNAVSPLVIPYFAGISKYSDEFGALIPTEGFYNTYETGDLRAQEQQFYFSKYPSFKDPSKIIDFKVPALYKYFHKESALGNGSSDENWTLLRLPEVMLIYAEASNEVSAAPAKAYAQLNAIRSRAKLPALSGLSQSQFREAVWKERYHELAYEAKAYFDIQRTRKAYDVANNKFVDVVGFKGEVGPAFQEKYLLWGIPSAEISNNKKLTQNPGW